MYYDEEAIPVTAEEEGVAKGAFGEELDPE